MSAHKLAIPTYSAVLLEYSISFYTTFNSVTLNTKYL